MHTKNCTVFTAATDTGQLEEIPQPLQLYAYRVGTYRVGGCQWLGRFLPGVPPLTGTSTVCHYYNINNKRSVSL